MGTQGPSQGPYDIEADTPKDAAKKFKEKTKARGKLGSPDQILVLNMEGLQTGVGVDCFD